MNRLRKKPGGLLRRLINDTALEGSSRGLLVARNFQLKREWRTRFPLNDRQSQKHSYA